MSKLPSPKKKYRWKQETTKHKKIQQRESEIRNAGKKHGKFLAPRAEWDIRKTIPNTNRDIQKETPRQTEITNGEMRQNAKRDDGSNGKYDGGDGKMNHEVFYV